jgi:rootletin
MIKDLTFEKNAFWFRLIDFNTRTRRETEAETERIRTSQTAAERALEGREKSHRARVKGLEEQVK